MANNRQLINFSNTFGVSTTLLIAVLGTLAAIISLIGVIIETCGKVPEVSSITPEQRIRSGEEFRVIFKDDQGEDLGKGCGLASKESYMGAIIFGQTYTVQYRTGVNIWITSGPSQSDAKCGIVKNKSYQEGHPADFQINLWGKIFKFDNNLNVKDSKFGNVGKLYFDGLASNNEATSNSEKSIIHGLCDSTHKK